MSDEYARYGGYDKYRARMYGDDDEQQEIAELKADNARLRSLLQALVAAGPEAFSYDADAEEGEWAECFYCGVMLPVTEHEADCPWLLAKQYLEAHNE